MTRTNLTLSEFNEIFPDEAAARAWFEAARRPDGPTCYHCGSVNTASRIQTRGSWECRACGHQFSVTAGTPMHRTHLPLLTWAQAIYLIVSSSKGISSMKLSEMLGLPYSTAWHLSHRIREMMADENTMVTNMLIKVA